MINVIDQLFEHYNQNHSKILIIGYLKLNIKKFQSSSRKSQRSITRDATVTITVGTVTGPTTVTVRTVIGPTTVTVRTVTGPTTVTVGTVTGR
ncbi:unnamed protein product, partial [Rotaria sordida]